MKLLKHILRCKLEAQIRNRMEQQNLIPYIIIKYDTLFIIKPLKENAIEYNVQAYLYFVDLTKVLDKVHLTDVIDLLKKREAPGNTLKGGFKYII